VSNGFRVDPEQLAGAATGVGQCAQSLGTSLQGLQATVTSANPWGADEPGTAFGMVYTEVLGHALEVYASHVDLLMGAADGLLTWAGTVAEVEASQAAAFDVMTIPEVWLWG
jgi:hypothetical protein